MSKAVTTLKDFEFISKLGEGAFAEVFKVKRKEDGLYYAMKKVFRITCRSEWQGSRTRIETTHSIKYASSPRKQRRTSSSTRRPFMMRPALLFASSWSTPKVEICSS